MPLDEVCVKEPTTMMPQPFPSCCPPCMPPQPACPYLDGVCEGHSDQAEADVGQQIAQRVHHSQGEDALQLQAGRGRGEGSSRRSAHAIPWSSSPAHRHHHHHHHHHHHRHHRHHHHHHYQFIIIEGHSGCLITILHPPAGISEKHMGPLRGTTAASQVAS